jgi:membrane protein implicated in regulation of membrane protease activity
MAVADAVAWRAFVKKKQIQPDVILNRRGESYVGRVFNLEAPIENGYGKMKVDDTHWSAECKSDLPAGTKVKVVSVKGTVLEVEAV